MNEFQELRINPERLRGEQVANLVKQVFEKYPFEITQYLVDSNVVLTLAGLKGQTEFFIDIPDTVKDEIVMKGIKDLGAELQNINPDLIMQLTGEPSVASDNSRSMMVNVLNLAAVEEWVSKTKLLDLPHFDKSEGLMGFEKWREEVVKKFGGDSDKEQMVIGVIKGYPDQAITDFIDWLKSGSKKKIQDVDIPHTGTYKEAGPIYSFYPEHANDPEIVSNAKQSSEVLAGFYESQWHKDVADNLSFKKGPNSKYSE